MTSEIPRESKPAKRLAFVFMFIGAVLIIVKASELRAGASVSLFSDDFSYVGSAVGVVAGGLYVASGWWLRRRTFDDVNTWVLLGPLLIALAASLLTMANLP
jgi:hypothetical protein